MSRAITGILMVILGLILIGISFFISLALLIYGIPILIIGIIIFFNKKEDKIEGIKIEKKIKWNKKDLFQRFFAHSLNRILSNERRKLKWLL